MCQNALLSLLKKFLFNHVGELSLTRGSHKKSVEMPLERYASIFCVCFNHLIVVFLGYFLWMTGI